MIDKLKTDLGRMRVARADPDLPLGIHEPKREGDVGWDLVAMEDVTIPPMTALDVPVNAAVELPHRTWAEIRPRSSISRRNLQVDAGTIDNGYRGRLFVLVRNVQLPSEQWGYYTDDGLIISTLRHMRFVDEKVVNGNAIRIQAGERIAQLVLYRACPAWIQEVEVVDTNTQRGSDGFGSTGR